MSDRPMSKAELEAYIADEFIPAMRKMLPVINPPPEWQPIETAPKDGTNILIAYRDGYFGDMVVTKAAWDEDKEKWDKLFSNEYIKDIPTHWMPLPKPPTV